MGLGPRPDVAVIGLGAAGSAVLLQLARRGVRAVGLDRYAPPHSWGSSHGETRISRFLVGEGAAYLPLVRRSHEIWRSLEAETGETLLTLTGGLLIGPQGGSGGGSGSLHHGSSDFVGDAAAAAHRAGLPCEVLDAAEVGRRYPQFRLRGNEAAAWEPNAGMLFPERCVAANLSVAARHGAELRLDETVLDLRETAGGVEVRTGRGRFEVGRAVVAAGPWLPGLLGGEFARHAVPYRQVLHWFAPERPEEFAPGRFPVFIWIHGPGPEDSFYGFPTAGTSEVKAATEQYGTPADPDRVERAVTPAEQQAMWDRHLSGRLPGLRPAPTRSTTCIYTVSPDAGFLVDAVPGMPRVLAVSACSGHGFKHSAALGEAVAELVADGGSRIPLGPFALGRLQAA